MSEEKFQPLNGLIPKYPVEALQDIANSARWHLKSKKRTNEQIIYVQNLIFELIEIYFNEEQEKEIESLKDEARANLSFHGWDEYPDLYPFALQSNRYGSSLEYIGDRRELESASHDNTDEADALYEVIDWLKDNETEEGFVDGEPCEYFYALSLSLVSDAVYFIHSIEKNASKTGIITTTLGGLHPITRAAMKAMKALNYGHIKRVEDSHTREVESLNKKIEELRSNIERFTNKISVDEKNKKATLKKATDTRHKKNRDAKNLVCADWVKNKNNFKSATSASEHYKTWLEAKGFYYTPLSIRNWILMYAKEKNIKW